MGELLILVGICGVLGLGAWLVERPRRERLRHDDWLGEGNVRR